MLFASPLSKEKRGKANPSSPRTKSFFDYKHNVLYHRFSSPLSDITTLDSYQGTVPTYGGDVYAYKVGRVCFLNIVGLGYTSNVPTGAWRYIPLGIPSRFAPIRECVAMLNFSGGEDSSAQFLCHLSDDATLSFYCYQTVTSGRTTLCYITA